VRITFLGHLTSNAKSAPTFAATKSILVVTPFASLQKVDAGDLTLNLVLARHKDTENRLVQKISGDRYVSIAGGEVANMSCQCSLYAI
jgi:hypothetical protein